LKNAGTYIPNYTGSHQVRDIFIIHLVISNLTTNFGPLLLKRHRFWSRSFKTL